MKTKLENKIKNQLDGRRIQPSEAAWDKLNQMLGEEKIIPVKKKKFRLYIPVAASVALIAGLFLIFNNHSKTEIQTESPSEIPSIVSVPKNESVKPGMTEFTNQTDQPVIAIETATPSVVKTENTFQLNNSKETPNREVHPTVVSVEKEEIPVEEISETEMAIAFEKDTVNTKKVIKNLVDPEMLLYSVENNKTVHTNDDNSKLVIIDFNKTKKDK